MSKDSTFLKLVSNRRIGWKDNLQESPTDLMLKAMETSQESEFDAKTVENRRFPQYHLMKIRFLQPIRSMGIYFEFCYIILI